MFGFKEYGIFKKRGRWHIVCSRCGYEAGQEKEYKTKEQARIDIFKMGGTHDEWSTLCRSCYREDMFSLW